MDASTSPFASIDKKIGVRMHNAASAASLVRNYQGLIRGGVDTESRQISYTLEFPDMFHAAAFTETARSWFSSINIRMGTEVTDLDAPVTLTAVTK